MQAVIQSKRSAAKINFFGQAEIGDLSSKTGVEE